MTLSADACVFFPGFFSLPVRCMAATTSFIATSCAFLLYLPLTYRSLFVSAFVPIAPTVTHASATRTYNLNRRGCPGRARNVFPKFDVLPSLLLRRYYKI